MRVLFCWQSRVTLSPMDDEAWRKRLDAHIVETNQTMLSQAEREMDLKTFIREQNTRAERALRRFEQSTDDGRDQLRANTAATWAMVDEIRGGGTV